MRTLVLASGGFMTGPDVKAVQNALRSWPGVAPGLKIDGEYGPATASAVARWKRYYAGYPDKMLAGGRAQNIGPEGQEYLLKKRKLNALWLRRAAIRRRGLTAGLTLGKKALDIGMRYRNLTELPAGSNKVPSLMSLGRDLRAMGWIANMGYAWCAYFVFVCYLGAGSKVAVKGIREYQFNALYTPTLLTLALEGRHGMRVVGFSEIQAGDPLLMNFPGGDPRVDHVGIAKGPPRGEKVQTLEGNTSRGVTGSQSNGGGVFERERGKDVIRAAIRFAN